MLKRFETDKLYIRKKSKMLFTYKYYKELNGVTNTAPAVRTV